MEEHLARGDKPHKPTRLWSPARSNLTARIKLLYGEAAWAVVSIGDIAQNVYCLFVFALRNEELRGFFKADDGHTEDGENEHQGAGCVPHITPSLVVCASARGCIATGEVGKKGPGKQTCDELTQT